MPSTPRTPQARPLEIGDRLCLREREAAAYLGVSQSYLRQARMDLRPGPRYVKFGRAVRYRRSDLDAYAQQHLRAAA